MADVDLDVHGVRYAQIYMDLKRDMKLQGLGFTALLDFTTVDTLRASLERVIADKTQKASKVESMCYYKKRRRGAVTILTQRDVMLACCEYPLVTRTGKPAPDTYIRVGVALAGFDRLDYRMALRRVLQVLPTLPGQTPIPPGMMTDSPPAAPAGATVRPATAGSSSSVLGSIVQVKPKTIGGRQVVTYRKLVRSHDDNVTFIDPGEPMPKRLRLAESMGWQLIGPSSPTPPQAMEIKPIGSDSESPDITIPIPPSLPIEIKSEPLDPDDDDKNGLRLKNGHSVIIDDSEPDNSSPDKTSELKIKDVRTTPGSEPYKEVTESAGSSGEEGEQSRGASSSNSKGSAGAHSDPAMRLMWQQLRQMESRLTTMEDGREGSLSPPNLTAADDSDHFNPRVSDLTDMIATLERRLLVMEQKRQQQDSGYENENNSSSVLEKRLAVIERTISRVVSSVDKLSKSLLLINRKHLKTNEAVEVLCEKVKEIRDSQVEQQSTLEQIQEALLGTNSNSDTKPAEQETEADEAEASAPEDENSNSSM